MLKNQRFVALSRQTGRRLVQKLILGIVLAASVAGATMAQPVYRKGYVRQDGVYVPPSYSTRPDGNPHNNYSTQGNYNPYTGEAGTVDPYKPSTNYGSGYQKPRCSAYSTRPC